ncbi:MAG: hypothetical protein H7225_12325 [Massilia sp.]|nr:hypothetical protein [Aquabacterium sp.]
MNPGYLQDALQPDFGDQLAAWHQTLGDMQVWALVDGAIAGEERMQRLKSAYHEPLAAFDATHLYAYDELGLFMWPVASVLQRDAAAALLQTLSALPALSFIASPAPAPVTCQTLAWLAGATTTDRLKLYLRIGDSRVIAPALANLTTPQVARLSEGIAAWAVPDRTGGFSLLAFASDRPGPAVEKDATGVVLGDVAYERILAASLPDMLHAEMLRADVSIFDGNKGSWLHAWLSHALERAKAKGVHQFSDQVEFARIARWVKKPFEDIAELESTWRILQEKGTPLLTLRQQWDESQWRAIEKIVNSPRPV